QYNNSLVHTIIRFRILPYLLHSVFFFSSRRRHTRSKRDWSSDVCSSDLIARWGAFLAPGVVLMPSFTNIGAYVGSGTMVDTWATVGSCAQVGENVHLSGGVGVGGVLEPPQASPVIVEDEAFLGSRSMVVEGARVRTGAKLGAGTILTSSTRVFDAETGEELPRGEAPAWSVCVTAYRNKSFPGGEFGMPVLLVLKRLEEGQERDTLALNDLLREHGVNA